MASTAPREPGPSRWQFPEPGTAGPDGVVGLGADLEPETLIHAYRRGIFPWPDPGMPLPWFSPDPRGVLPLDALRISRSLRRRLRRSGWQATVDQAFPVIIGACARRGAEGTWITPAMRAAYTRLHELAWAHSVEIWDGDSIVGGLYGVQLGGIFTGESMFHRVPDASSVALVELVARLREAGASLIDVQVTSRHLARFGARDMPRVRFLELLKAARDDDVRLAPDRRPVDRLAAEPPGHGPAGRPGV